MSIYSIITAKSAPVFAKDATRRELPKPTLSMAEDAKAWKARKADAWGEGMSVKPEQLSASGVICWTPERNAALEEEIIDILRQRGPHTVTEMLEALATPCNRHKVNSMLTLMRAAGKIDRRKVGSKRNEWWVA